RLSSFLSEQRGDVVTGFQNVKAPRHKKSRFSNLPLASWVIREDRGPARGFLPQLLACTALAWRRDTDADDANSLSAALYRHLSGRLVRLFRQPIGLADGRWEGEVFSESP